MAGQENPKKNKKGRSYLENTCISLIFFLSALLLLLLGIRVAGNTIQFAQAEKIEIINNLVDGLSESSKIKTQGRKVQNVVYKYLEALVRAVANFEFIPRNDFTVLTQILNTIPEETEIAAFVYHGRNLTIQTTQPDAASILEMVESLEKKLKNEEDFADVVYSYYKDEDGEYIAEITLIAHQYDEKNLGEELSKFLPNSQ